MRLTTPMLLALITGGMLLWCGITDRNPAFVIKAILTGTEVPAKGSGNTIPGTALPGKKL